MGYQLPGHAVGQADIEDGEAFSKLQKSRDSFHRTGRGLAQEIDVEIGCDCKRDRSDMRQNRRIGRDIGQREQCGTGNRTTGPQMLFIGVKAHRGGAFIDRDNLETVTKLRKLALHEGAQIIDIHHRSQACVSCHIDIHPILPISIGIEAWAVLLQAASARANDKHSHAVKAGEENMDNPSDAQLRDILQSVKTIALLGASPKPERPSNGVMEFLLTKGYHVIPVNPGQVGKEIHGQRVVGRLADIEEPVDMVDVFREPYSLPTIVDEILAMKQRPSILWTQLGVVHEEAGRRAEEAGLKVVMDRCPAIEYPRLIG